MDSLEIQEMGFVDLCIDSILENSVILTENDDQVGYFK